MGSEEELIPHFAIKKFISGHDLKVIIDEDIKYSNWEQV